MPDSLKETGTLIKTYLGSRISSTGDQYDTLLLIYRDSKGEKKTIFYDRPEVSYYTLKDRKSEDAVHPPMYEPISKLEKHTTYSDNLFRDIAINTGALSFYDRVRFNYGKREQSYNLENLFKSPLLYNADMDIQDQYIAKFYREHNQDQSYKLYKAYTDIETDLMPHGDAKEFVGFPDPKEAPCPINLITLIDSIKMESHTFILRNPLNKLLTEFISSETKVSEFEKYMHDKVLEIDSLDMKFNLYFYDTELDLLKDYFKKLHEINPDVCGIWNSSFDLVTIQNRLIKLCRKEARETGVKPEQMATNIMCDLSYSVQPTPDGRNVYVSPRVYYREGVGKTGKRMDSFTILDGTFWIDQMLLYGVVHAPEGKPDSFKLDYISNMLLHKGKLEKDEGETIRNEVWVDPVRFIEYNIQDVLLLLMIENNTHDIDHLQTLSEMTCTRKDKAYSKSISLTNYINKFALQKDLAMRTNKNMSYGSESAYYEHNFMPSQDLVEFDKRYLDLFNKKDKYGAFVSDPLLNDFVGMEIFSGKKSRFLYEWVCDQDFSSLYPSIIRAYNLDSLHIKGKFYCIDDETKQKLKDKYDCADMFYLSTKDADSQASEDDEDDDDDDSSDSDELSDDDIITGKSSKKVETDDLGPVLADTIMSQDWSMLGEMFFDLPSTEQIINKLKSKKSVSEEKK
jgi:hypothetical protein